MERLLKGSTEVLLTVPSISGLRRLAKIQSHLSHFFLTINGNFILAFLHKQNAEQALTELMDDIHDIADLQVSTRRVNPAKFSDGYRSRDEE